MCYRPSQPRPSNHRPRWGIYSLVRASVAFHFCCPCCRFHLSLGHRRRRLSRGHHRRRRWRTDSVASIGPLLAVSRTSAVPLSNSLDIIAADTDTKCRVPCLHLVFGRQSVDEDGVQHVFVNCQSFSTHFCVKILDPTHLLEWDAPRRYIKTIKAPGDVGYGPRRLRAVLRKESDIRFPWQGTPV